MSLALIRRQLPAPHRAGPAAILAVVLLAGGLRAQDPVEALPIGDDEYFIRTVSKMGQTHMPSARSRAMGGVYAALSNGAGSINENPSALGAMNGRGVETLLGYDRLDNGSNHSTEMTYRVGGAMSLNQYLAGGNNQTVGLAYSRRDQDRATTTGEFSQDAVSLAYGSNYGSDLLWGLTLSAFDGEHVYHYNTLYNEKATFSGGEITAGMLFRLGDDFTVGGTASYAGGSARSRRQVLDDDTGLVYRDRHSGDLDIFNLRFGAAWQMTPTTLLAGDLGWRKSKFDVKVRRQELTEYDIAVGIEHALIPEKFVARAGANYHHAKYENLGVDTRVTGEEKDHYLAFTAGFGARMRQVDFNYALDIRTSGDIGNFFSAQFGF